MYGTLYIVATPIGNLSDVTLRAVKILSEVDIILAEDTRVTKKLLNAISEIRNDQLLTTNFQQLISYNQHSGEGKKLEILKMLTEGKNVALVTDAGTPGISDPGNELISFLLSRKVPYLPIVPIPGPSALATALSVSGFDASKFVFLGFWPKKKSGKVIKLIKETGLLTVFYESPYRILKTLKKLEEEFGSSVQVLVARELTKIYETLYRGTLWEVRSEMEKEGNRVKGEIVVVLKN